MARLNSTATTLNLESLNRMLALEEAMLANPNLGANTAAAVAADESGGSFPSMESLRSPTTRTLMYILEHRNAHGMISAQFAMAEKERETTEDLAERADELLKEPLLASYGTTVKAMLQTVSGQRLGGLASAVADGGNNGEERVLVAPGFSLSGNGGVSPRTKGAPVTSAMGAGGAAMLQPLEELLAEEQDETTSEHKRRSTQRAIAVSAQPNQRTAVIHGTSLDDPDVQALASVCFVLPKNEAGTVIAQRGVPSSLLHRDTQPAQCRATPELERDAIHDSIAQLTPLASNIASSSGPTDGAVGTSSGPPGSGESGGSTRGTLLRLLAEQRLQFEVHAASRHEYEELLRGYQRWQKVRAEAFDAILESSVPHTTVQDSDFEVFA